MERRVCVIMLGKWTFQQSCTLVYKWLFWWVGAISISLTHQEPDPDPNVQEEDVEEGAPPQGLSLNSFDHGCCLLDFSVIHVLCASDTSFYSSFCWQLAAVMRWGEQQTASPRTNNRNAFFEWVGTTGSHKQQYTVHKLHNTYIEQACERLTLDCSGFDFLQRL